MSDDQPNAPERRSGWMGAAAILAIHAIGFLFAYCVLVFITPTFAEHYRSIGAETTARFDSVYWVSNIVSAYTLVVLLLVAVELASVAWVAMRKRERLSAYSHLVLATLGLMMFISVSWMIQPMAFHEPVRQADTSEPAVELVAENTAGSFGLADDNNEQ